MAYFVPMPPPKYDDPWRAGAFWPLLIPTYETEAHAEGDAPK